MRGVYRKELRNGTVFLGIAAFADPDKGAEFLEERRLAMLTEPETYRRHYLGDMTMVGGEPVYKNYSDDYHCPHVWRETGLPVFPSAMFFGGWDCGQTLSPAFVLFQVLVNPYPQIHAILEVTSPGGESMERFAPRVAYHLQLRLPGMWDLVRHYADATVTTRSGTNGRSAQQEARKSGFEGETRLRPVSNAWQPRYGAQTWAFGRRIHLPDDREVSGFFVDAKHCPVLRQAYQGHYKWRVSPSGDESGPGQVILEPQKNSWSHVAEAAQYPLVKIRKMLEGNLQGDD